VINQDLLFQKHLAGAESLINRRARLLKKACNGAQHQATRQKLIGHLSYLGDFPNEIDFTDAKTITCQLCVLALQPRFSREVERVATELTEANVFDHLTLVFEAIDITGFTLWKAVLQYIILRSLLPDDVSWKLVARFSPLLEPSSLVSPTKGVLFYPGQLSALACQSTFVVDSMLNPAFQLIGEQAFEADLYWFALRLNKSGHHQTSEFMRRWLDVVPGSPWALRASIVSGRAEFASALHQAVKNENIEAVELALHGCPEHLVFCLELLKLPRFNKQAAELWERLTATPLTKRARIQTVGSNSDADASGDHVSTSNGGGNVEKVGDDAGDEVGEWACPDDAEKQYRQLDPSLAYWRGQPFSQKALVIESLHSYGAHSERMLHTVWAHCQTNFVCLPNEPNRQRQARLKEVAT
jgi:hypothetical protein